MLGGLRPIGKRAGCCGCDASACRRAERRACEAKWWLVAASEAAVGAGSKLSGRRDI